MVEPTIRSVDKRTIRLFVWAPLGVILAIVVLITGYVHRREISEWITELAREKTETRQPVATQPVAPQNQTSVPHLRVYNLVPGGDHVSVLFRDSENDALAWYGDGGCYQVRYIKQDGMTWNAPGCMPGGWIWAIPGIHWQTVYQWIGEPLAIQFRVPATRIEKSWGRRVEKPCAPVTLHVSLKPIRDPS